MRLVYGVMWGEMLIKIFEHEKDAQRFAALRCDEEGSPEAYQVEEWRLE